MCIYKERERESSGCQNIGAEERGFLRNYISAYIIKDSRIGDSNYIYIYICLMISLSNSKSRVSRIIWPLLIISYNKKGLSIWGRVRFNKREKRLKSQSCDLRMHSSYKHVANPRAVNPKQNKWYTMQIHAVYSQWSGIDRSWQFTPLANYPATN